MYYQEDIKSLYIHIPFCKKICSYCDFCKNYYNEDIINKYLDILEKEVLSNYKKEELNTIYIGGGTPSCLNKQSLNKLLSITNKLNISSNIEFTFECNIEDINKTILETLKNNKVNRISIGVESFNKDVLRILERIDNEDYIKKLNLVKKYFDNINIDLMYGIKEDINILKEDINIFLSLNISHISLYSLILEDNTKLKIKDFKELDEDLLRDMYDYIEKTLENNNYIHYEVSNYSKKGYESKHNLCYWNNNKYYGFGLGASGYIDNYRYDNTKSINKYLDGNTIYNKEELSLKEDMENFMILGLRKLEGVSNKEFYKRYNKNINDVFDTSKLKTNNDMYFISKDKIFISNSILIDFID